MSHPEPVDSSSLMVAGEYEEAALVQSLLPRDYSMVRMQADLWADADWSGYQPEEAIEVLKELGDEGLYGPRLKLAELYSNEDYAKSHGKKAYSLYKSLYDKNRNAANSRVRAFAGEAALRLGRLYEEGVGVKASVSKGFKWLELAADLGNLEAQYVCGKAYALGEGVDQDRKKAIVWLLEAAKKGDGKSRVLLGRLYLENPIAELQKDTLIDWLKRSLDEGLAEARGVLLKFGIEYRMPKKREATPGEENEKESDPWVPIEVA